MHQVRIRAATDADVPALVALVRSAYRGEESRTGWTTEADLLDGQRTDLTEILAALARSNVTMVLAISDAGEDSDWTGEAGLITDVVDRMEDDLEDVDAYLCGPPPMVDAAIALLERRGCPESRIYFDKFTTGGDT